MRFPRTTTIVPRRKFEMKKIMFNDRFGLTTAVIEGRKTMTRRVINLPEGVSPDDVDYLDWGIDDNGKAYVTFYGVGGKILGDVYPNYQPGESVAVAQCYETVYGQEESEECQTGLEYFICDHDKKAKAAQDPTAAAGWKNKMFVEAGLMPYWITIEGLTAERLQDITDEDCLKEGVQLIETPEGDRYVGGGFNVPERDRQLIRPITKRRCAISGLSLPGRKTAGCMSGSTNRSFCSRLRTMMIWYSPS